MKIEPLKRNNLIIGQNNTGKTGVLEALVLLLEDQSQNVRNNLPNLFRTSGGDWNENFWKWLFHNKSAAKNLEIKASFDAQKDYGVIFQPDAANPINYDSSLLHPVGQIANAAGFGVGKQVPRLKIAVFSTHPSNPTQDAIDYNRVILKRRKKQVEKMLREIEPRLEAVEALQTGQPGSSSSPLIYADLGLSEMIPVTQLGQGFNRLLDIYWERLGTS
jgi:hypothetical protein